MITYMRIIRVYGDAQKSSFHLVVAHAFRLQKIFAEIQNIERTLLRIVRIRSKINVLNS